MGFSSQIIGWYQLHKRDLPFRETRNPYHIWISEIILQQTRMEQGVLYYQRFIERFPSLEELAKASEEAVLTVWAGLGYYSRARNLHAASREIMKKYQGGFPRNYEEIRSLPGIGDYTAGAIASIAFRKPFPAIDGNVYRFLSRYFVIRDAVGSASGKKKMMDLVNTLMDHAHPDLFNQALIEFGALVCTPHNPRCWECIFQASCGGYEKGMVSELPLKQKVVRVTKRYFHYLVIISPSDPEELWMMTKRTGNDIWRNLYDFPLIETTTQSTLAELAYQPLWRRLFEKEAPDIKYVTGYFKHKLTHQEIHAQFIKISLKKLPPDLGSIVSASTVNQLPKPRLIEKYLQQFPV